MTTLNIMTAAKEWMLRPFDQRFASPTDLVAAAERRQKNSVERTIEPGTLRVLATNDDVCITARDSGAGVPLSNWAFAQCARFAGAPAHYLRTLPAALAADALNHGLQAWQHTAESRKAALKVLVRKGTNDTHQVAAITSNRYGRVWDLTPAQLLHDACEHGGWRIPPARPCASDQPGSRMATDADVSALRKTSALAINVGDPIAPAGIYMGDRDLFTLACWEGDDHDQLDDGKGNRVGRAWIQRNSETGAAKYSALFCLYVEICGNHIIWGATDVATIAGRHVGRGAIDALSAARSVIARGPLTNPHDITRDIATARRYVFGPDIPKATAKIATITQLPATTVTAALAITEDTASIHAADVLSAWGVTQGLTELSQKKPAYVDARHAIDLAAGRVMNYAVSQEA